MAQVKKDSIIFRIGIKNRPFWFFLTIFGILMDVFVFKFTSDLLTLIITGFWIFTIRKSKLDGRVSLFGGLIFLVICSLFLMFKLNLSADKTATWVYIFLTIGIFQTLWKYKKEKDEEIL